jgi:hypothetical protein
MPYIQNLLGERTTPPKREENTSKAPMFLLQARKPPQQTPQSKINPSNEKNG